MTVSSTDGNKLLETLKGVVDNVSVGKVFGTPIEHDGTLVLPVAKVGGGAGGGGGESKSAGEKENGAGLGAGLGLSATPAGIFVITGDKVRWHPALDVNRIVLGGQLVAIAALLVARAFIRSRPGARRRGRSRLALK